MKKERLKIAFYIIIALLDFLLLFGALILQYYADKKMGVMRYLVAMRYEFEKGWFSPNLIKIYSLALEIGFILYLCILILSLVKKKGKVGLPVLALAMLADGIGYILITSNIFLDLKAYYFILTAILIVVFLQSLLLVYELTARILLNKP